MVAESTSGACPTTSPAPGARSSAHGCRGSSPIVSPSAPDAGATLRDVVVHGALVAAGAFVLVLAFPRTDWSGGAWVALVPLITLALLRRPRAALALGWFGGFVFF